jgi:putative acetyltransferase
LHIRPADFDDDQVRALLIEHVGDMLANSPPGTSYALDLSGLDRPDVSFFAAWDGEALLGFGALKALNETSGELKSMRTARAHLRKGVARALLAHLLALASARGYHRVSLETGAGPTFEPALALYRQRGFMQGAVFGDYVETPFNQFFHLDL